MISRVQAKAGMPPHCDRRKIVCSAVTASEGHCAGTRRTPQLEAFPVAGSVLVWYGLQRLRADAYCRMRTRVPQRYCESLLTRTVAPNGTSRRYGWTEFGRFGVKRRKVVDSGGIAAPRPAAASGCRRVRCWKLTFVMEDQGRRKWGGAEHGCWVQSGWQPRLWGAFRM